MHLWFIFVPSSFIIVFLLHYYSKLYLVLHFCKIDLIEKNKNFGQFNTVFSRLCLEELFRNASICIVDCYFGLQIDESSIISIHGNRENPVPQKILKLIYCLYTKNCVPGSCPFVENSLLYTHACNKEDCAIFMRKFYFCQLLWYCYQKYRW